MKNWAKDQGFTLIELIFFMVMLGLVVVGIVPLVDRIFSDLHRVMEYTQGYFLAQGVLEQTYARNEGGAFDQIVWDEACLDPNEFPSLRCEMDVVGATFDADTGIFNCTNGYSNENYKCVTVTIYSIHSNEVIAREKGSFPRR